MIITLEVAVVCLVTETMDHNSAPNWTKVKKSNEKLSHHHFHHMDRVPAPFDLLRSIPSLLDENDSSKAVIQVPEVHRRHTTLKVTKNKAEESQEGDAWPWFENSPSDCPDDTHRSLYWSKALLASTSSFLSRPEGIAPSSIGGSYLLLHGDLRGEKDDQHY